MIILGAILLAAGYFLDIGLLWTAGVVLMVIGLVLLVAGRMGHAVGAVATTTDPAHRNGPTEMARRTPCAMPECCWLSG